MKYKRRMKVMAGVIGAFMFLQPISGVSSIYGASLSTAYETLKGDYSEFVDRMKQGGASETQIQSFIEDIDAQVQGETITQDNADEVLLNTILDVVMWGKHESILTALVNEFDDEIAYMQKNKKLSPNLAPIKNAVVKQIVTDGSNKGGNSGQGPNSGGQQIPPAIEEKDDKVEEGLWETLDFLLKEVNTLYESTKIGKGFGYYTKEAKEALKETWNLVKKLQDQKEKGKITKEELQTVIQLLEEKKEWFYEQMDQGDIADHWSKKYVLSLVKEQKMKGYPDGTFRPEEGMTRAEFATVLCNILNLEIKGKKEFADTSNHWAKGQISAVYEAGIVKGYGHNFKPDELITREDMLVMVTRSIQLLPKETNLVFKDEEQISSYAKEAIDQAVANGILSGYEDQTFRPKAIAKRGEVAKIVFLIVKDHL